MPLRIAAAVLEEAERRFGMVPEAELTVEANPDDQAQFAEFRRVGFNRLSLGVQSLDDPDLTFLGRNHSAGEAVSAIAKARATFPQLSLDFIYALPEETAADWERRLSRIVRLEADHLSLYQLTIEPDTAFGKAAERGRLIPAPDGRSARLYRLTQDMTEGAGYPAYEISNHARPGAQARHNSLYWDDAEWIGIGPGAHGRLEFGGRRWATAGLPRPSRYPNTPLPDRMETEPLDDVAIALETLASGLRPRRGLRLSRLASFEEGVRAAAQPLLREGLLAEENGYLRATEDGALLLDGLTSALSSPILDASACPA
jgi:oxygen-independent coproporphyrinogen-3 oxidase